MLNADDALRLAQAVVDALHIPLEMKGAIVLLPDPIGYDEGRDEWMAEERRFVFGLVGAFMDIPGHRLESHALMNYDREWRSPAVEGLSFYVRRSDAGPGVVLAPSGYDFDA